MPGGRGKATTPRSANRSRSPRNVAAETSATLRALPALVINLEKRTDRWERAQAMLQKEVPWLSKCERLIATDGRKTKIPDHHVAQKWNTKNNSNYGEYEDTFAADKKTLLHSAAEFADPGVEYFFSPGERGCAYSHYRIWQQVAKMSKPMLVLEDDVQLCYERNGGMGKSSGKTFTATLERAMQEAEKKGDMDVLYLGWAGHRDGNYRYNKAKGGRKSPILRKVEYVWTTVAYVLWPAGAKKLLKAASPMNQPVDNFMAWEAREGRLNSYVVLDEGDKDGDWAGGIVDQLDFHGDSDIVKSDGGDQGDSTIQFLVSPAK